MVIPVKGLLALVTFFFFRCSAGDRQWCASPQYIELAKKATIYCSLGEVYAISWYNSTILRNEYPIIHYTDFVKGGVGYASGEFDIHPNGSLLIGNVSLSHDHYFAVEYLQSDTSDPVVINIHVIVIVKPQSRIPVVHTCKDVRGICFRHIDKYNLTCSVERARPIVPLQWTVKTVLGDRNISFYHQSEFDGQLFSSRASTTDTFKYTSRLALAVCTAQTLPQILERLEYQILLQNSNQSISTAEPIIRYAERYSKIELSCSENSIGFLAWWKVDLSSRRFSHPLLYAVLIGNHRNEILDKGYEMGREGSLIVPQVDIAYQGIYSCIFSNGVSDGVTVYEIIVYVYPIPNYPVIEGCNHDKYCVLDAKTEGNLTCSVYGIRPKIVLHWMAFRKEEPIYFKPKQLLIVERRDTFDISLSTSYHSSFIAGDRVTVVCKVIDPDIVLFDMTTTMDLIFSEGLQTLPTTEATYGIDLPPKNNTAIIIIIIILVVVVGLITALVVTTVMKYRVSRKKMKLSTPEINEEEGNEMQPLQPPKDEDYEDLQKSLKIYLKEKTEHLSDELDKSKSNLKNISYEFLRKVCFMGVEISGDATLQESAINLLNIATQKKVYIRSVIFRECFGSVNHRASAVITKSNQRVTRNINFTQLNIDFGNQNLREGGLHHVKMLFTFASRCRKLRTLKFTNCVLPPQFEDISVFKDLQNKKVEVHWENGFLIPKYVLNLSTGQWENDVDGCRLNDDDYDHLTALIRFEDAYKPGYMQLLKGARSYSPRQMALKQRLFQTMETVFKLHGAETIDTPLFELKETFADHFEPEYSRLTYYLNDQGNESVSLRFDLTTPFVHYVEMNNVTKMKHYHIGKVFRRESSVMKGRSCGEIYQCDFNIAGEYECMVPDAECIETICTILRKLNIEEFIVRVNHQKVLQGLSKLFGIPKKSIVVISDLIDSIPHTSSANISKILNDQQVTYGKDLNKLLKYLKIKAGKNEIERLLQDEDLVSRDEAKEGLQDLKLLFQYCDDLRVVDKVQFEMSLTRSLGYYTGLVFEAVFQVPKLSSGQNVKERGILANGGRFDNMVTKFTGNKMSLPCVGFTFDCEHLFTILEFKAESKEISTKETEVLVTCSSPYMPREILKLCKELWNAGVKAESSQSCYENITYDDKRNISFVVCFTKEETP